MIALIEKNIPSKIDILGPNKNTYAEFETRLKDWAAANYVVTRTLDSHKIQDPTLSDTIVLCLIISIVLSSRFSPVS